MKIIIPRRDETTIEITEKSTLVIRQVDNGGESHVIEFALDDAMTVASEIDNMVRCHNRNNDRIAEYHDAVTGCVIGDRKGKAER